MVRIELSGGPHDGLKVELDERLGIPESFYTRRARPHFLDPPYPVGDSIVVYYKSLKLTREGRLIYEFKPWLNP